MKNKPDNSLLINKKQILQIKKLNENGIEKKFNFINYIK